MDWLFERFAQWKADAAIAWPGGETTYAELLQMLEEWEARLNEWAIEPGQVVALQGDYSPQACSLLLSLWSRDVIVVPLTSASGAELEDLLSVAQVELRVSFDGADRWSVTRRESSVSHPLIDRLRAEGHGGLVLFSSGSTGKSKAVLHDARRLLEKFETPRRPMSTLVFLLLDHIGGINTLLHVLSNGGKIVALRSRDPDVVCATIEEHGVELLPTSPTFLSLLLMSESHARHDLSSLKLVTYGTEVMPEATLKRIHAALPWVRLQQTYGLSELGILRSKSAGSDSPWVKVGGEGFETRIVDGIFHIRARSAMLGYLNAPSPFDAEGWMNTGDRVELRGDYLRFLGRDSDLINVGGLKVQPDTIENVVLQMDGVRSVLVCGESHPVTGQIVSARVSLAEGEELAAFRRRMRDFCRDKLQPHEIPVRVRLGGGEHNARFKRIRPTPPRDRDATA